VFAHYFTVFEQRKVPAGSNVLKDEMGEFQFLHAGREVVPEYRKVTIWNEEKQVEIELLTNHFALAARTIGAIYKDRWQIELFFKAIKQNLRIKTFVGTSANAVHIQVWTALIAMPLIKYPQFRSSLKWAMSNLVAL